MTYTDLPDGTIFVQIPEHDITHFFWELNPDKSDANFTYVASMVKLIYQHRKKVFRSHPNNINGYSQK